MLRYLDNSDDVKVGITELKERLEISAVNENGQTLFEFFRQTEELCIATWARWDAQLKGLVELEKGVGIRRRK